MRHIYEIHEEVQKKIAISTEQFKSHADTHPFEGDERSIHELKLVFFQTLFEWVNA